VAISFIWLQCMSNWWLINSFIFSKFGNCVLTGLPSVTLGSNLQYLYVCSLYSRTLTC
jgi:hypothetical protein